MLYFAPDVEDEDPADDGGINITFGCADQDNNSLTDPLDFLMDMDQAGYEILQDLHSDYPQPLAEHSMVNETSNDAEDEDFHDLAAESELEQDQDIVLVSHDPTTSVFQESPTISPFPSPSPTLEPFPPPPTITHEASPLHIQILTNYDPVAARFYTDARIRHTGLPQLLNHPPRHQHLRLSLQAPRNIQHLHLEISTPFRALLALTLHIDAHACAHVVHWAEVQDPSLPAARFSRAFRRWWQWDVLPGVHGFQGGRGDVDGGDGSDGFTWEDVQALARLFRCLPDQWGEFADVQAGEQSVREADGGWGIGSGWSSGMNKKVANVYDGAYMNEGVIFGPGDEGEG